MKRLSVALLAALFSSVSAYEWVNGLNLPVHSWGNDFGVSFDYGWYKDAFYKFKNDGANTVRIWMYFNCNTGL